MGKSKEDYLATFVTGSTHVFQDINIINEKRIGRM
jgi:hypothetical protein